MKIVTFNIRCCYYEDGRNSFVFRAGIVLDAIKREAPDVICFQEVTDKIRAFLCEHLTAYHLVGVGRNANYKGEGLTIAYKKDDFDLLGLEHFWFSPTPHVPGSRYPEQSPCPRVCVTATLKHKNSPTPIRFYNIHLDHESDSARILGVKQLLAKVEADKSTADYPCVILGDFNATPESEPLTYLQSHAQDLVDATKSIAATFHNFGKCSLKIDYIFLDKRLAEHAKEAKVWDEVVCDLPLSDHYPVELCVC